MHVISCKGYKVGNAWRELYEACGWRCSYITRSNTLFLVCIKPELTIK